MVCVMDQVISEVKLSLYKLWQYMVGDRYSRNHSWPQYSMEVSHQRKCIKVSYKFQV